MKKLLPLPLLFSLLFLLTSGDIQSKVYICKGKSAKKYHLTKSCRGLSNCSTDIYQVSKEEAVKMGRGLCGWED